MLQERPKISVIVPIYNVETYLNECLDSLSNQTLGDIEVLCVSDGSTDGSERIVEQFMATDNRFKLLRKLNLGYGHTMNFGLDNAKGEYVSFVESDDYVMPDMFENLYRQAKSNDIDIIKANYCEFTGSNPPQVKMKRLTDAKRYNKVFRPLDEPWSFYIPMMNCLGLFNNDFLTRNHIRHNETPGASHQDMGFWFQTLCLAERFMLVEGHYYMYRQDNPNSSINQINKVYPVLDEYQYMFRFLQKHPELLEKAYPIYFHRMFGSCCYRYSKLAPQFHMMFLNRFSADMKRAKEQGILDVSRFTKDEIESLDLLITDIEGYRRKVDTPDMLLVPQEGIAPVQQNTVVKRMDYFDTSVKETTAEKKEIPNYEKGLISVIIPIYNTAQYLSACLDHIVNQTYKNIEIICVDDGSTDDSLSIAKSYARIDDRIKIVEQENGGQARARNHGTSLARGEYIYYMDSDDVLDKDALETLVGIAEEESLDILFFDADTYFEDEELAETHKSYAGNYHRRLNDEGPFTGPNLFVELKKINGYRVSPCLFLVRHDLLFKHDITFPEGIIYEDNVFALKCILEAERADHKARCFYTRRVRAGSTVTREITFKNFYGYFICYLEIGNYLYEKDFPYEVWKYVLDELRIIYRQAKSYYGKISASEQSRVKELPAFQLACFERIFQYGQLHSYGYDPERELELVKSSLSFRIGQAITWLPRKIRGDH